MRWIVRMLAAACVLAAGMGQAQQAPQRFALVIGNAAYTTPGWQLANPVNDARLIASRLAPLGFQVTKVENATKPQMEAAVTAFAQRLAAGGDDAVGVLYYAGHAAETGGENLLVPIDVTARTMDDLRYQGLSLNYQVLRLLAGVGNRVNVVVLDACRNVPLPSLTRAGPAGGLTMDDVPTNILLAYSTRSGATAPDNAGESNSVFTRTLADVLATSAGDPVETLFTKVQSRVATATGFTQRPEFRNQLLRAPEGFALAAASGARPAVDPELERLRRENEALRRAGAGVASGGPPASSPASAVRPSTSNAGGTPAVPSLAPGQSFRDCSGCPEMIVLRAGSFTMGSPSGEPSREADEGPQRVVNVRSFAAGKYEVTFDEWMACANAGGCGSYAPADQGWGKGNRPVINVSWNDAQAYVQWLSQKSGKRYRLLTEAEWEYAARAGTQSPFSTGAMITPDQAQYAWIQNYNGSAVRRSPTASAPAGSFPANPWGLFDMHGNVYEWVEDCYKDSYAGAPQDGSEVMGNCAFRVHRGGSWNTGPVALRSAFRSWDPPLARGNYIGFRVARGDY